jgi:hypothetical protein
MSEMRSQEPQEDDHVVRIAASLGVASEEVLAGIA